MPQSGSVFVDERSGFQETAPEEPRRRSIAASIMLNRITEPRLTGRAGMNGASQASMIVVMTLIKKNIRMSESRSNLLKIPRAALVIIFMATAAEEM